MSFDVPISNDNVFEGNERFILIIPKMLPDHVSCGDSNRITVTIGTGLSLGLCLSHRP